MDIHLISVGKRMPKWVVAGYEEYAKRLPRECALRLIEISPGYRSKKGDLSRTVRAEGERMLRAIPENSVALALDLKGVSWSTEELALQLETWIADGRDRALLVGGPDGLDRTCLERADGAWSLSALTLPHPLVRIVLAEQIYRAWSMMRGHPYHRG